MKVLILDDEPDIRFLVTLGLTRFGSMQVSEAADGDEAVALAVENPPDVILLDVLMPGIDGPGVLARLRAEPAVASVPVIFLTANPTESDVAHLLRLGARGVIPKPFDPVTLGDQIRSLLDP